MDRWKVITLVSVSFSAGMIYTTACGTGGMGPALALGSGGVGTVGLSYDAAGRRCESSILSDEEVAAFRAERKEQAPVAVSWELANMARSRPTCSCPPGWSFAGWASNPDAARSSSARAAELVCVSG